MKKRSFFAILLMLLLLLQLYCLPAFAEKTETAAASDDAAAHDPEAAAADSAEADTHPDSISEDKIHSSAASYMSRTPTSASIPRA